MKQALGFEGVLGQCIATLVKAETEDEKAAAFILAEVLRDLRTVLRAFVKR